MDDPAGLDFLEKMFQRIINLSFGAAFIALVIVLVVTGIKYLTSGGEPKALSSAHNSLTWALLGMLFLVIVWLILLLIEHLTGVQVTKFCLSFLGC
ncbi:MAG: hypothetical protein V1808_02245 [Candidatus Daviesbacteria bacterium]